MSRQDPMQHISRNTRQFQLCMRTFAPWRHFGGGFEGDDRDFSTSPHDTFRIGAFVVFDLDEGSITEGPAGTSSGTRRDEDDAKVFADVEAKVKRFEGDPGRVKFDLTVEGANPMVPMSPDIDNVLSFVAFLRDGDLFMAGEAIGDGFPNTEVFVRDNQGNAVELIKFKTNHGRNSGAMTLLGAGSDRLGRFKEGVMLDPDTHTFIGDVPFDQ
ncbi:MAG: hypothetical protein AAF438_05320 [Pseudomonadota bacterium]